jgi:hypothetical protein
LEYIAELPVVALTLGGWDAVEGLARVIAEDAAFWYGEQQRTDLHSPTML